VTSWISHPVLFALLWQEAITTTADGDPAQPTVTKGVPLVWFYALIRDALGAQIVTALKAAFFIWIVGFVVTYTAVVNARILPLGILGAYEFCGSRGLRSICSARACLIERDSGIWGCAPSTSAWGTLTRGE